MPCAFYSQHQSASKDLDSLLESQRSDKNMEGPSPAIESTSDDVQNRNSSKTEASPSIISSKPFIKFVKAVDRPTEDKIDKVETTKKPTVKYAEQYKKPSKKSNVKGNISYLSDYDPFDGGYVSFGRGYKITGKGTIKTGKLEFKNMYFVKDLRYNLFSVSQICDNKNSVLFTDSERIVLGRDFELIDDINVFLRTPRQHNMYSINLNNIVPHKDFTCLVAKASADECMLWHKRLGHLNFKTMNKLVRHNLVRGLHTKYFENDHNCTACLKGKQHKASCKTKLVSSVTKPLHTLHMDLFGPTSGEGSGTSTEPHHTPTSEASQSSQHELPSPSLPPVPTASLPTVIPSDTSHLRQYTKRTRIAQSSALPPVADEPASPVRDDSQGEGCPTDSGLKADQDRANIAKTSTLPSDSTPRVSSLAADEGTQELEITNLKARVKMLEDREGGGIAEQFGDDAPINGRSLNEGEEAAERVSDDTEEMATVLTFMNAVSILTSGGVQVVPTAAEFATATEVIEFRDPYEAPDDVVATGSKIEGTGKKKGRTVALTTKDMQKRKNDVKARTTLLLALPDEHQLRFSKYKTAQELRATILKNFGGNKATKKMKKSLLKQHSGNEEDNTASPIFTTDTESTPYSRRNGKEKMVESDTPKKKKLQEQIDVQIQQRKPLSRKQQKEFYMSVLKSHAGWKARHFKGMTLEEIKEKFDPVWKQFQDFIPIGSKEEAKRFKRKGLRLEQDSTKKLKTSKEVPEEKLKEMMELIPIEEHFDRDDLTQLWDLVKESLRIRPAISDKEMERVELKRLNEFPLPEQLPTAYEDRFLVLIQSDATAQRITLLLKAVTPNEPVDSLSMGDENLNTIPTTESDEFIKSCVENLVPNPSESDGETECDVPAGFTTLSNVLFDADYDSDSSDDQSLSDEDVPKKIYSNPFFDEEIIPMVIDLHSFNAESDLIESMPNNDSSIIIPSKIDSLFDEFAGELTLLKSFPPGIDETDCHPEKEICLTKRLLYENSSPRPPEEFVSDNSNADVESFSSSPIPIKDSDSHMEEIDLSLNLDDQMPSGIEEEDYDSERDILIPKDLPSDNSLSFAEKESFHFDIPPFSRLPAKPPDGDIGILNIKIMGDIYDQKALMHKLMIILASHQEKSPDLLSYRYRTVKNFNTHHSHLNTCSVLIHGQNNPPLDVLLFHFYPP
nr:putative ribonuclease H-like domain-containing protein [Tanacetum cinerariifolium]